jgi:hypothetical protein
LQYADDVDIHAVVPGGRPTSDYYRPAWTAELRRIEALILAATGVTWS